MALGGFGVLWCIGMLLSDMDYDRKIRELWRIDDSIK